MGVRKDLQKIRTVLQDVLVLSTGKKMTNSLPMNVIETPKIARVMNLNNDVTYSSITIELDPYDAQKLAYIQAFTSGRLSLSLRNNADKEAPRLKPTQIYDVLGEDASEERQFISEKYSKEKKE
jgi:pilus assembly protein CpaB